jgi:alpha-glucan phosphorylase-like protein
VPTVTTDMSGFGAWALEHGLGEVDGVTILRRAGVPEPDAAASLAQRIERFVAEELGREGVVETCRATASRTSWTELIGRYYQAFDAALELARSRAAEQPMLRFRPRVAMPVAPAPDGRRPRLFGFEVSATVPPELSGLERLARNYSWCWDPDAPALFEEISPVGWTSSGHNPVLFLRLVFPEDLAAKAADRRFVERVREVVARFEKDLARSTPPTPPITREHPVAYFSAEFGVHESLRIYSGGLGILAGDHLKSASDVGLPLVGVGLFYRAGYLRQRVTATGDQIALEADNDPRNLPLELVRDRTGQPIEVTLQLPSTVLALRAWRARVGRIELYLLDANHEKNRAEDRGITHQLYGGDHEHRLRQEIVLGRGGVKLLAALGIEPSVFHINEGHAAFLVLERTGALIREQGLTFDEARELVRATTVFTTHTPVPAGHDRFGEDLMRRYFSDVENWLGVKWERFLSLGTLEGDRTTFNMTYLAMGFASFVNGVSKLHGEVSRDLLRDYWPRILKNEVPVGSITNGVHLASWMHPRMQRLLGAASRPVRPEDAARSGTKLDPAELWRVRRELRQRLLDVARANLERQFVDRHDSPALLARMLEGLDEDALLVGFARRFAPYKRSNLILRDLERLRGLLDDPERPMRVLFAGKAHPRDGQGLEILRSVVELTRRKEFAGKVFFLEDYDIELARALVQGVDVWLNNPVRTLEASGTSGMKAAANGAVNLSVPDGWWVEGFDGTNGWNVGEGRTWNNPALQDELDGQSIVQLLADEVLPAFFERDRDGLPRRWLELCSRSLATIPPLFNTDRMVTEYRDRAYVPLARRWAELTRDRYAPLRARAASHARLRKLFGDVSIVEAQVSDLGGLKVGDAVEARVRVSLGELAASDVEVELLFGHSRDTQELRNLVRVPLAPAGAPKSGVQLFQGSQKVSRSGTFAYGLRVRARVEDGDGVADELVLWA